MTPAQKTTVANILKGDLQSLSHQRLIELCLLYEAAPDAYDTFPTALKTELERRFTAAEIGKSDVLFAVLQKKANTYQSAIPLFHQRLLEMAGTVNRDIWFTDNKALFESAIADADVARWLVQQRDILEKCLHNRLALAMLAESATASSAILTDQNSLALWKNTPDLWDIWPQHTIGMTVIAKSAELTQYIIDTPAALTAVVASQTAMTAVASVTAALKTVLKTNDFRTALMASNTVFQAARAAAYQTVSASGSGWVKQRSQVQDDVKQLNPTVAAPLGFVFACLGYYNAPSGSYSIMTHPGGGEAARAASTRLPTTMASVDGISFNGATFTETGDGYAYAELWAPA